MQLEILTGEWVRRRDEDKGDENFDDGAVCDASGSCQDMALAISVKNKK
jgi:hypothetical protein